MAKAGSELYNNKSEVILVRDGDFTTITMSNDFKGNVRDFAMVVPVPNILARSDIQIADRSVFQKLDAYSSPRLVEYFDQNPCRITYKELYDEVLEDDIDIEAVPASMLEKAIRHSVTIEAMYNVEEYEILILSATKSAGLKQWLTQNGYKIPSKAEKVLEPYIKSGLKFFVVKVNLEKYDPSANGGFLRPLQIKVNSRKFMLPIRLGMANSKGEQDMIVYAFSKQGRVECSNYRTVKMPTNMKVPTFVKPRFGQFYKDVFKKKYKREGKRAVMLEYAWNVTPSWGGMKCDPCVGTPPYATEFLMAGVPWTNMRGVTTYFTRLHVRYTQDKFPEDLFFIETPNREMYQARYVITHPANGDLSCDAGVTYSKNLRLRREEELLNLGDLADWDTERYYDYMDHGTDKVKSSSKDKNNLIPIGKGDAFGGPDHFHFGLIISLVLLISYAGLNFFRKELTRM